MSDNSREHEAKRMRLQESTFESLMQQHVSLLPSHKHPMDNSFSSERGDLQVSQLLEHMRNSPKMTHNHIGTGFIQVDPESQEELIESLRTSNTQLKKELEKKEYLVSDLIKKLHDALETIRMQTAQLNELQQAHGGSLPLDMSYPSEENIFKVPAPINRSRGETGQLELRVLQQPPSQAVYQRILRPFPTVAVMGYSTLPSCTNLFVEVSLLKQDDSDTQTFYRDVYSCKSGAPLEGEKKNLIGGQLVQRSEVGSPPDGLVVVFRKLKILTTTAQQGGAFFLLKFVLKRYVDNQFETVPNVTCAISDPIEVFSHTLYLKGRAPGGVSATNRRGKSKRMDMAESSAAIAAATALVNARQNSAASSTYQEATPSDSSTSQQRVNQGQDALSSLAAASVDSSANQLNLN